MGKAGVGGGDFRGVQKINGGWWKNWVTAKSRLVEKIIRPMILAGQFMCSMSCHDTDGDSARVGVCHVRWLWFVDMADRLDSPNQTVKLRLLSPQTREGFSVTIPKN